MTRAAWNSLISFFVDFSKNSNIFEIFESKWNFSNCRRKIWTGWFWSKRKKFKMDLMLKWVVPFESVLTDFTDSNADLMSDDLASTSWFNKQIIYDHTHWRPGSRSESVRFLVHIFGLVRVVQNPSLIVPIKMRRLLFTLTVNPNDIHRYELGTDLRIRPLGSTVTLRVNLRIFMGTIRLGFYTTHIDRHTHFFAQKNSFLPWNQTDVESRIVFLFGRPCVAIFYL